MFANRVFSPLKKSAHASLSLGYFFSNFFFASNRFRFFGLHEPSIEIDTQFINVKESEIYLVLLKVAAYQRK